MWVLLAFDVPTGKCYIQKMATKKRVLEPKNVMFPKVRLEAWRLAQYRAAHVWVTRKTGSKLNFSEWIRQTIDDEVEAVFEQHGVPPKDILKLPR